MTCLLNLPNSYLKPDCALTPPFSLVTSGGLCIFTSISQKHPVNSYLLLWRKSKILGMYCKFSPLFPCLPSMAINSDIVVIESISQVSTIPVITYLRLWSNASNTFFFNWHTLGISVERFQVLSSLPYYSQFSFCDCFYKASHSTPNRCQDTHLAMDSYQKYFQA